MIDKTGFSTFIGNNMYEKPSEKKMIKLLSTINVYLNVMFKLNINNNRSKILTTVLKFKNFV